MEHDPSVLGTIDRSLLDAIEARLNDELIPILFLRACEPETRHLQVNDEDLRATGISTDPEDFVLPGVCQAIVPSGQNICTVVKGAATIFIQDGCPVGNEGIRALEIIRDYLASDRLNLVNDGIMGVNFIRGMVIENDGDPGVTDPTQSPSMSPSATAVPMPARTRGRGLPVWTIVLLCILIPLLFLLIYVGYRRYKRLPIIPMLASKTPRPEKGSQENTRIQLESIPTHDHLDPVESNSSDSTGSHSSHPPLTPVEEETESDP